MKEQRQTKIIGLKERPEQAETEKKEHHVEALQTLAQYWKQERVMYWDAPCLITKTQTVGGSKNSKQLRSQINRGAMELNSETNVCILIEMFQLIKEGELWVIITKQQTGGCIPRTE